MPLGAGTDGNVGGQRKGVLIGIVEKYPGVVTNHPSLIREIFDVGRLHTIIEDLRVDTDRHKLCGENMSGLGDEFELVGRSKEEADLPVGFLGGSGLVVKAKNFTH